METRQISIEQLVINYFLHRSDVNVILQNDGNYSIRLLSESARQLLLGDNEILLTFDPNQVTEFFDGELITSTHPLLEVIRNELEGELSMDPRVSEGHVLLQFINEKGDLSVPQVNFHTTQKNVIYHSIYNPYYILTYQVVYDTDERSDNLLKLCFDGNSGELQPEILTLIENVSIVDGPPTEGKHESQIVFNEILEKGQKLVEERIQIDLQTVREQISDRLRADKDRLQKHFDSEVSDLRSNNGPEYQQIEARFHKDLADLEKKYICEIKANLLSALILWVPDTLMEVAFEGNKNEFTLEGIRYDIKRNETIYYICPNCGNYSEFDVCLVGKHTFCSGNCKKENYECSVCHDSMCLEHGELCSHCGLPVCQNDHQVCSHGTHEAGTYFCPNCTVKSFENKLLCKECQETCTSCNRSFSHEQIKICRVGQEHICTVAQAHPCGSTCNECGQISCKEHGLFTADNLWVCTDHSDRSTCCNQIYGKSRLKSCVIDPNEKLCGKTEHRSVCLECNGTVCMNHSHILRIHPKKRVCDRCKSFCEFCSSDVYYIKEDLAECKTCKKSICVDHSKTCAVCNRPLCKEHTVESVRGEYLCKDDSGECAYCQSGDNIYRKSDLFTCDICKEPHCKAHDYICPICKRTHICKDHVPNLSKCASCGRASCEVDGCSPRKYTCPDCGKSYCQQCFKNGRCIMCNDLLKGEWHTLDPKNLEWLKNIQSIAAPGDQQFIATMLRYEAKDIYFKVSQNLTHAVYLVKCNPSIVMKFLNWDWALSNKQIRVVTSLKRKNNIKVKVEECNG